jgi:hypothetical protein
MARKSPAPSLPNPWKSMVEHGLSPSADEMGAGDGKANPVIIHRALVLGASDELKVAFEAGLRLSPRQIEDVFFANEPGMIDAVVHTHAFGPRKAEALWETVMAWPQGRMERLRSLHGAGLPLGLKTYRTLFDHGKVSLLMEWMDAGLPLLPADPKPALLLSLGQALKSGFGDLSEKQRNDPVLWARTIARYDQVWVRFIRRLHEEKVLEKIKSQVGDWEEFAEEILDSAIAGRYRYGRGPAGMDVPSVLVVLQALFDCGLIPQGERPVYRHHHGSQLAFITRMGCVRDIEAFRCLLSFPGHGEALIKDLAVNQSATLLGWNQAGHLWSVLFEILPEAIEAGLDPAMVVDLDGGTLFHRMFGALRGSIISTGKITPWEIPPAIQVIMADHQEAVFQVMDHQGISPIGKEWDSMGMPFPFRVNGEEASVGTLLSVLEKNRLTQALPGKKRASPALPRRL